jgi:hypothetical protein
VMSLPSPCSWARGPRGHRRRCGVRSGRHDPRGPFAPAPLVCDQAVSGSGPIPTR